MLTVSSAHCLTREVANSRTVGPLGLALGSRPSAQQCPHTSNGEGEMQVHIQRAFKG